MAEIARIPTPDRVSDVVTALHDDGAVIVEGFLDAALLRRFNAELDPLLAGAGEPGQRRFINDAIAWFFGDKTDHVTGIAGKSPIFVSEILVHPLYEAVCDAALRAACSAYQLNLAHVLDRGPGAEQQLLHRDEDIWVHLPRPHPEVQVASIVALVEFTADNGATVVVPGSHRWERSRQPEPHEVVPAEMPAGSAVLYLGSTIHAGGTNRTADVRRRAMHVSYCAGWLRTEENQYLTTPIELVRTLPRRAQELLGFAAHDAILDGGGYLGTVELQDPVELIARGEL